MKRLFLSLAAVAALSVGMASLSASAYEAPLLAVDDPIAMHDTFDLVGGLILQDVVDTSYELVAVDNTISALCRGDAAADHAGFCDAVADNQSAATKAADGSSPCAGGKAWGPPDLPAYCS